MTQISYETEIDSQNQKANLWDKLGIWDQQVRTGINTCTAFRQEPTALDRDLYSAFCSDSHMHCIHVPHIYPFICRWTFRLLPCLGYCKQCCCEHWGANILLNYSFLWICARKWDCQILWQLCFQFFKEPPYYCPYWLYQFSYSNQNSLVLGENRNVYR